MAQMTIDSVFPETCGSKRNTGLFAALICCVSPLALFAQALPDDGSVIAGDAQIGAPVAGQMTVNQTTSSAVINWGSFNVGASNSVHFAQPSTNSSVLNRVTGGTGTEIHGQLTGTGSVHIVNPNGILIGPNGTVQTGSGFVASTLDISTDDFMSGALNYNGNGASASVENAGRVTVGRGGYAAFLGGHVSNSGTVTVPMGRVAFGSGERATLDLSGDGFLQIAVPTNAESADGQALIDNAGTVSAEGGLIEMRAATAKNAVRHAINLSGVAEATSVHQVGGAIVLGGGNGGRVNVTGRVSTRTKAVTVLAQSPRPQTRPNRGGEITVTGAQIVLEGTTLDASGAEGGGLIRIGGDFAGAGDLQRADTLQADAATTISTDAFDIGGGGRIVLWSDLQTDAASKLSSRGGANGGDGGFVEVSSKQAVNFLGHADTRATVGNWGTFLLDPTEIIVNAGGGANNEDVIERTLATSGFILDTTIEGNGSGDITINADINWDTATTLSVRANRNIILNGPIIGERGGLTLGAGSGTINTDNFKAGDIVVGPGGNVNVNLFTLNGGNWGQSGSIADFSTNDFRINGGEFRRAATDASGRSLIVDIFGLQGIGSSAALLGGDYILANDIDAGSTNGWNTNIEGQLGFNPIGNAQTQFTGTFDGAGNTISGLSTTTFGRSGAAENAGLFNTIGTNSTVQNVFMTNADVNGRNSGTIAAVNFGTISGVNVEGRVIGTGAGVGGIVGINNGVIRDSRADVTVIHSPFFFENTFQLGGAVGSNTGTISTTHSIGSVSIADTMDCCTVIFAGGFVGRTLGGSISDSYARGNVDATSTGVQGVFNPGDISAGGFAGNSATANLITRSYSTGRANAFNGNGGQATEGGFVGSVGTILDPGPIFAIANGSTNNVSVQGGTITADAMVPLVRNDTNFWDINTSGLTTSAMGDGLTTANFQNTTDFVDTAFGQGWVFEGPTAPWAPGKSGLYPSHYATSPVAYAVPDDVEVVYGDVTTSTLTISGGDDRYLFGPARGAGTAFGRNTSIGVTPDGGPNVGTTTFASQLTGLSGRSGQAFDLVSATGNVTITPRPLTIRANDASKVYGQVLNFGLGDINIEAFQTDDSGSRGIVAGDTVTSVTITSDGTSGTATVAGSRYAIVASDAQGTGLGNYDITYGQGLLDVTPATLTLAATDEPVPDGLESLQNGVHFNVDGTLFNGDTVDGVLLTASGGVGAAVGTDATVPVFADAVIGAGSENYSIQYAARPPRPDNEINIGGEGLQALELPPPPVFTLPNPADITNLGLPFGIRPITVAGLVAAPADPGEIAKASQTLAKVRVIADGLEDKVQDCANGSDDVEAVLACLSDALNNFATELDRIVLDLPPELGNVARIILDAQAGVDAARAKAARRLATATTEAERQAIQNDAIAEAKAAVDAASIEIRNAIQLVRVTDPELANIQRATIISVAQAVDTVSIELSRVTGL